MTGQMRTSSAGLDLIRSFEGFRETSVRLPDGRWTVGYGHVRTAREGIRISEADALELLVHDLKSVEDGLGGLIYAPVNQNQFDALVSLAFNISLGQFRDSDVLQAVNAGDEISAAAGFDGWRKARINGRLIIVDALVRRRAAEKALFLEPVEGRPSAPTPIVTPVFDKGAPAAILRRVEEPQPYAPVADEDDQDAALPAVEDVAPDIARAVADLAGRLETMGRTPASPGGQNSNTPSAVAAQRLSKILARVESKPGASAGGRVHKSTEASPHAGASKSSPDVPQDLPDFRETGEQPPKPRRRVAVDDTEIVEPNGSVDDIFSAALEQERLLNRRGTQVLLAKNRVWALAPWFAIAVLCAVGLGVAIVESISEANSNALLGGAAPTMIAVFGLLLAMSGYYIVTKLSEDE